MDKTQSPKNVVWLEDVGIEDVALVGGKNASLGEMIRFLSPVGIRVPGGFVVTTEAYRSFLDAAGLDAVIRKLLDGLDTRDIKGLARCAAKIRAAIIAAHFPPDVERDIAAAYARMEKKYGRGTDVAVRSSATAEDLQGASFAGEHETYLGVRGIRDVQAAVKSAMASLFTARAISYRAGRGFWHLDVALAVTVQRMVRADTGASGVMFTLDTESGFRDVVLISASWGLGEPVVQGRVAPDEYLVFKKTLADAPRPVISKKLGTKSSMMVYRAAPRGARPVSIIATPPQKRGCLVLDDADILTLARWGVMVEEHYTRKNGGAWTPMDLEWAKDGRTGELYIVQARPETVQAEKDFSKITEYVRTQEGVVLARGVSVGSKIGTGRARVILSTKNIAQFRKGEVLVTDTTDPDWEPVMKLASAIVTDKGGRTSHAAIISRELGIPAVVGATGATRAIRTGMTITVDASGGEGVVFRGSVAYKKVEHDAVSSPQTRTKIMMNIATPGTAFEKSFLPNSGVGLAREEFIIASEIGVHPLALIHFATLPPKIRRLIAARTAGWPDKTQFYVDNLAYGVARIAAAFYPKPVIVRFSDFKTNEYRALLGGELYEPQEENPMLGWRGAARYYDPAFKEAFALECRAMKKARDDMGLTNVIPMVPFCRTPREGERTLEIMAAEGLMTRFVARKKQYPAENIVPVYVMCEIPSNILMAEEFLEIFDGMSIGSNDLTQLALGLDRDSGALRAVADENSPAVRRMIADIIRICKSKNKYIGICGQAPSDYPDFALFLVEAGIESISLTPDTVIKTTAAIAEYERNLLRTFRHTPADADS